MPEDLPEALRDILSQMNPQFAVEQAQKAFTKALDVYVSALERVGASCSFGGVANAESTDCPFCVFHATVVSDPNVLNVERRRMLAQMFKDSTIPLVNQITEWGQSDGTGLFNEEQEDYSNN